MSLDEYFWLKARFELSNLDLSRSQRLKRIKLL